MSWPSSAKGLLGVLFLSAAPWGGETHGQIKPQSSLSFKEIQKLASAAIAKKEVSVQEPAIWLRKNPKGRDVSYVFPGDSEEFRDFRWHLTDVTAFALAEQMRLQLLRTTPFLEADDRKSLERVCDQAEKHLQELLGFGEPPPPPGGLRRVVDPLATEKRKRDHWIPLYRFFEELSLRAKQDFGGITAWQPTARAWTLLDRSSYPFAREQAHVAPPGGIKLLGPAGVEVLIVKFFLGKLFQAQGKSEKDWSWEHTYSLDPQQPPVVHLSPGSRFYFLVRRGTSTRRIEKTILRSEREYNIPLPE